MLKEWDDDVILDTFIRKSNRLREAPLGKRNCAKKDSFDTSSTSFEDGWSCELAIFGEHSAATLTVDWPSCASRSEV